MTSLKAIHPPLWGCVMVVLNCRSAISRLICGPTETPSINFASKRLKSSILCIWSNFHLLKVTLEIASSIPCEAVVEEIYEEALKFYVGRFFRQLQAPSEANAIWFSNLLGLYYPIDTKCKEKITAHLLTVVFVF